MTERNSAISLYVNDLDFKDSNLNDNDSAGIYANVFRIFLNFSVHL